MSKAKSTDNSFFNMGMISKVVAMTDLDAAKELAMSAVTKATDAKPENIRKAGLMINSAKSVKSLGLGMSSFMLANGGMKVIK